jgi:IPT/TIG domain
VTPASGPAGTKVTILGSGFQSGTAVTANGIPAATTFVSASTLQVVVPSVAAGSTQITVTNPVGETYSLDNAFTTK